MTIDLPQETQNMFFSIAKEKNITPEALAREAIIEWLEDLCDTKEADTLHQEFAKDKEFVLANNLYEELTLK